MLNIPASLKEFRWEIYMFLATKILIKEIKYEMITEWNMWYSEQNTWVRTKQRKINKNWMPWCISAYLRICLCVYDTHSDRRNTMLEKLLWDFDHAQIWVQEVNARLDILLVRVCLSLSVCVCALVRVRMYACVSVWACVRISAMLRGKLRYEASRLCDFMCMHACNFFL